MLFDAIVKLIKRKESKPIRFSKKKNNSSKTLQSDTMDGKSNTVSVTSTLPNSNSSNGKNFQYIEGRRYNNDDDVEYLLPNDHNEADRLHEQHWIFRYALQCNYHSPIKKRLQEGISVLDAGCGPATWTFEMAESYPNSKFTGVDVSFVFPEAIRPPNVSFEISNIARELTFADNTFDFYFQRLMIVALNRSDYALALKNAYRVLKPGGYIELVEPNLGDFGKMGPLLKDLLNTMSALMEMKGMTPNLGDTLEDLLKVAGFVNIQVIVKVFPINHTNKIGKLWWEDIERGYHNVRPMLALKNPDFEEPGCYKKYLDGIADECAKHMTDSRLHIVYAQKPFN